MTLHSDPTVRLLGDLVAIDSVNPTLVPGAAGELAVARRVAEEMRAIGMAVTIVDAAPGRPNVVGTLTGIAPGRSLMFCGHTDTVGVAGMARPFDPQIRDGRLYGRGAQDMKGGLAAMLGAARAIRDGGGLAAGRLTLAAAHRADAAVVTEPTGLDVAVAHKGFQWVAVETRGRAAHGSRPRDGRDAILRMGRVLAGLEALDRRLQAGPPHPLLGTGSLHASLIHGGRELSSYPDRAWLEFERRTLPGEPASAAYAEVSAILQALRASDAEFDAEAKALFGRDGYEVDPAASIAADLTRAAASAGVEAARVGMSFWTDA